MCEICMDDASCLGTRTFSAADSDAILYPAIINVNTKARRFQ